MNDWHIRDFETLLGGVNNHRKGLTDPYPNS